MDLSTEPTEKITGKITPEPSKFYTQFATAVGLLTEEKTVINSPLLVDDTRSIIKAIDSMGATTKRSKKKWAIWGTGKLPKPIGQVIDAKKSIVGLSLLTSLSALASRIMVVTGKKQIRSCRVPTLIKALQALGVDVHSTKDNDTPPLVTFESKIKGGKVSLDDGTNPKFIPAFLLLTPYADKKVELKFKPSFKTDLTDMAIEIMENSGIDISVTQRTIRVPPDEYGPLEVTPPLDMFTTLPYVVGAAITGSELTISKTSQTNNVDSFVSILKKMGVNLKKTSRTVKILASQDIGARRYSLEEFPEILPFAAVLACTANGKTIVINSERARNMKSDRISAITEGLRRMGAKIEEREDGISLEGPAELKGTNVNGYEDDAIVSSLGVAGIIAEGETRVKNRAEILRESYPNFVSTFKNLGAEMSYKS